MQVLVWKIATNIVSDLHTSNTEHTFTTFNGKLEIRVPFDFKNENLIYLDIWSVYKEEYTG